MNLDHLSYSSLTSYLYCPRNWRFKYFEKQPTFGTPELAIGSAVHGAIEEYLSQPERVKQPADFFKESWGRAIEGQPIVWGAGTPEQHYNEGIRILSNEQVIYGLSAITPAWPQNEGPKIEEKVELNVPGVPLPVIGYIDIQTADGIPGDFKTSSKSWSQERAQNETQSLFYLAALNQAGRTVPDWKFRHYVIVKTKTPQFQAFEHTHRPDEIFWLFSMILNIWKGIEAGVFPENPTGWKCSAAFCDFWTKCRGRRN
ncbi:MAG: RecB family exonuclease [Chloroflexota bacterium]